MGSLVNLIQFLYDYIKHSSVIETDSSGAPTDPSVFAFRSELTHSSLTCQWKIRSSRSAKVLRGEKTLVESHLPRFLFSSLFFFSTGDTIDALKAITTNSIGTTITSATALLSHFSNTKKSTHLSSTKITNKLTTLCLSNLCINDAPLLRSYRLNE